MMPFTSWFNTRKLIKLSLTKLEVLRFPAPGLFFQLQGTLHCSLRMHCGQDLEPQLLTTRPLVCLSCSLLCGSLHADLPQGDWRDCPGPVAPKLPHLGPHRAGRGHLLLHWPCSQTLLPLSMAKSSYAYFQNIFGNISGAVSPSSAVLRQSHLAFTPGLHVMPDGYWPLTLPG